MKNNERKSATASARKRSLSTAREKDPGRKAQTPSRRKAETRGAGSAKQEGGVAAVDRALEILAAFEPTDTALTLAELAQKTRFYKSTILRISQSLIRHRYLQRLDDGSYRIGPAPLMLGALYQRSMRLGDIMLPLMHELADQTGESVSVYSRNGDFRVCLHRVDSKHAVRDHVREGDVLPLERGSGGRILLAFGGTKGEPYETIRTEYCYASVGERDSETAGLSVPFFGTGQTLLGALTLAGPRSRIDETFIANARVLLLRIASRATHALGGDASPIDAALAMTLAGKRTIAHAAKMGVRT
jgi:DNA-binding IclR family transcriptional regulator